MNTLSIFMAPVARKFNLLRVYGNFFIKLRKEVKEINGMDVPPEGEFLSSMFRAFVVITKVGALFFASTILPMAIMAAVLKNIAWFGQQIISVHVLRHTTRSLKATNKRIFGV